MRMFLAGMIGLVLITSNPIGVSERQVPLQASQMASSDLINAGQSAEPAKLQNDDKQKQLQADTDKLLTLATDLKAQVDKSTKDTLSLGVIKKADEIEKLAHSVKLRMKG